MKKALFLTADLERGRGEMPRFAAGLLPAWRNTVRRARTEFEPLVLSLHDPTEPLLDLKPSVDFPQTKGFEILEAVRGGEKCYFIDSPPLENEKEFEKELQKKYGIPALSGELEEKKGMLLAFWKNACDAAETLKKSHDIAIIDAQDWLAFPAGFLAKEKLGLPLYCRFHSCEYGRALGKPEKNGAPLLIEAAALAEADFVQAVSVSEAKSMTYHLLPEKQGLCAAIGRNFSQEWKKEQAWKDLEYDEFLLLESDDIELIGENVAGITNGIDLDEWKQVGLSDIQRGRGLFRQLFEKKHYVFFLGRPGRTKGLDVMLRAFALAGHEDAGLVVSSALLEKQQEHYRKMLHTLGLEKSVAIHAGWLDESVKKSMLAAADVVCLPSLYEPFALVALEALAADLACENNNVPGPAVVVGATGGMNEVIRNGVNGFKCPMDEDRFEMKPEFLARVLDMLFRKEPLRRKAAKGGAERIGAPFFDWNFVVLRHHEAYRKAIENYRKWHAK